MTANVKEAVVLLCNILGEMSCSPVQPETLRKSKFDDQSVVADMWKLLFELVIFKNTGSVKNQLPNEQVEITIAEMAVHVKRDLFMEGYNVGAFIALPLPDVENPSNVGHSSRELLLAFGWLLATGGLMEKFALQCIDLDSVYNSELKRQLTVDNPKAGRPDSGVLSSRNNAKVDPRSGDMEHKINEALAINGKLQTLFKSIAQADREQLRLLQRMEISNSSPDITKNPSTYHIALSCQADLILDAIKLLENDKRRLTFLVHWKQSEHVFWQWLESALDEKLKNCSPVSQESLVTGYRQLVGNNYTKMTDLLMNFSRVEKSVRDCVKGVAPHEVDELIEMMNNDLNNLSESKPHDLSRTQPNTQKRSESTLPPLAKSFRRSQQHGQGDATADSHLIGLQKLHDRLQLELDVSKKEFSSLLKRIEDATFS